MPADPVTDRGLRSLVLAGGVGAGVVALDQITKAWVVRALELGPCGPEGEGCIELVGSLRFHFVENSGAAFSAGPSLGPLFGVIAMVMVVFLLNLARTRADRLGAVVLGAIVGGAVGNLVDRLTRAEDGFLSGSVVDFIDLQWFPVFNVADSAVVCGVIAYAVLAWRADAEAARAAASEHQDPSDSGDAADGDGVGGEAADGGVDDVVSAGD